MKSYEFIYSSCGRGVLQLHTKIGFGFFNVRTGLIMETCGLSLTEEIALLKEGLRIMIFESEVCEEMELLVA